MREEYERILRERLGAAREDGESLVDVAERMCSGFSVRYSRERRRGRAKKRAPEYDIYVLARIDEAVEEAKKKIRKANAKLVAAANAEGERTGAKSISIMIAKNLLSLGSLPVADIARATGLSLASVNQLSKAL